MTNKDKFEQFFEHSAIFLSAVESGDFGQDDLYKIHLEILKIEGKRLESVEPELFTADQYLNLCSNAIGQNSLALEWVDVSRVSIENYRKLCYQAVKQNSTSLYFVKKELFENSENDLRVIYNVAVHQNTDALFLIRDQTLPLCLMAVKKNTSALQWVNPNLFSREDYTKICYYAFYQKQEFILLERIFENYPDIKHFKNYQGLRFVNKDYCLPQAYKEICLHAIKYSGESLPFVDESLWLDRDFCREALKLSRGAKKYVK
ncbi:hypothetical protein AGMMS49957_14000 [Synergistales bacterium]|nr:hypothetical protein AGMMS49957_14000 [Synergistales bacterium]